MAAVFTTSGEFWLNDLITMTITGPTAGWYIGWGSGTTTEAKSDVDLEAAATEARVTATSEGEVSTASDIFQVIGTLTKTAVTADISEAGLFWDATSTASDILIHGTHTAVSLATEDQIRYTITLEFT